MHMCHVHVCICISLRKDSTNVISFKHKMIKQTMGKCLKPVSNIVYFVTLLGTGWLGHNMGRNQSPFYLPIIAFVSEYFGVASGIWDPFSI